MDEQFDPEVTYAKVMNYIQNLRFKYENSPEREVATTKPMSVFKQLKYARAFEKKRTIKEMFNKVLYLQKLT